MFKTELADLISRIDAFINAAKELEKIFGGNSIPFVEEIIKSSINLKKIYDDIL